MHACAACMALCMHAAMHRAPRRAAPPRSAPALLGMVGDLARWGAWLVAALSGVRACRHPDQQCFEPGTPSNHSSCCAGLVCNGPLHAASSVCVVKPPPGPSAPTPLRFLTKFEAFGWCTDYSCDYATAPGEPTAHPTPTFSNINVGCDLGNLTLAYSRTGTPGWLSIQNMYTGCEKSRATHGSVWGDGSWKGKYPDQNPKNQSGLAANWREALASMMAAAAPAFRRGAMQGVFLGDELMCQGVPLSNYTAVADGVKAALLALGLGHLDIWGNECELVFEPSSKGKIFEMPLVPRNLSIFSIDRYMGQGTPYPQLSESNTSRQFLSDHVVAKMDAASQQLFVVPGLFGDRDLAAGGSMAEQSLGLRKKLLDYWRWLSVDPTVTPSASAIAAATHQGRVGAPVAVAGIAFWHWLDFPTLWCKTGGSGTACLGVESFPEVLEDLQAFRSLLGPHPHPQPPRPLPPPSPPPHRGPCTVNASNGTDCAPCKSSGDCPHLVACPAPPVAHATCCGGHCECQHSMCPSQPPAPPAPSPLPPPPPGTCRKAGESCNVIGNGGGINPAAFAKNWVSNCCSGLMCRLGGTANEWNCTPSTPHGAGPNDLIIRSPQKLPPTLPAVSRVIVQGEGGGAYKPWLLELGPARHSGANSAHDSSILMAYRAEPSKALAFQRSSDSGMSWSVPEIRHDIAGDGEWSLHKLRCGVILLSDGGGRMYRSTDGAISFSNCTRDDDDDDDDDDDGPLFNCTDECGSWTVIEVLPPSAQQQNPDPETDSVKHAHEGPDDLPAGVYTFVDRSMWRSTNEGQSWRQYSRASAPSGHMPRDGQWGHDEFFSQSQVYRRRDRTFLHSARMNTEACDGWAGEQLWQSNDSRAEHWRCRSQAAGGYCDGGGGEREPAGTTTVGHSPKGCYHQADVPIQCTGMLEQPWLKPGNHYSHWLRLHDGRLLLTWTHRSNVIDDDGYGTGTRGLISYDDGTSFDFAHDYVVIFAQSDDFCNPPVPWKGEEIELCCTPAKGGCACEVGYGNTLQLTSGTGGAGESGGDLLTATSFYNASQPHTPYSVAVTRWRLPSLSAREDKLKTDDIPPARRVSSSSPSMTPLQQLLIGVHYFGGWYPGGFSHWMKGPLPSTTSWLPDWPGRTPLLGLYTTNATTVRAELAAADAHGVDFFEMLWYSPDIVGSCKQGQWPADPNMRPCTNTPAAIMMAHGSSVWPALGSGGEGIRFALSYSNDLWKPGEYVGAAGLAKWLSFSRTFVRAMGHPRYLRVGGRPVFKVFAPYNFLQRQCSGNQTLAHSLISQLRAMAVEAGVGNPLIGGGWIGEDEPMRGRSYQGVEYDYCGNYNSASRAASLGTCIATDVVLPWSQLADNHDGAKWVAHSKDAVTWVPNIDAGYDTRAVPGNRSGQCTFAEPSVTEWTNYLRKVKSRMLAPGARFGLPLGGGKVQPALTVYAWNEFAEGGIIAPTQGQGWSRLQGIAEVFGHLRLKTDDFDLEAHSLIVRIYEKLTSEQQCLKTDDSSSPTARHLATAAGPRQKHRSTSWWWHDDHHTSVEPLVSFCTQHRDIVTRVMLLCEVFTCVAADWSNASAPRGTCTNNHGVGGVVTGKLSDKCKQAIPALSNLGIETELWLGEDDSITSAHYQFAHADEVAASLLEIAKENPGLSGFNLDLESHSPFNDTDRQAYRRYLHDVTTALRTAPPLSASGGSALRFSADLECRNPAQDLMMANCSAVVPSAIDRIYTMYTYNSADYYEWATVQLAPALQTVPLDQLGVGLGCWIDSSLNGTWNTSPQAAEDRVCKLMNESVQEIGMFLLSQGVKGNPNQKFPPAFWIEQLQKFMRGDSCEARVPVPPHCPNKAWNQGGYSNDWDCCTSSHNRGNGKSCDVKCAQAECKAAGMKWLPLNNSIFPFTCCNNHSGDVDAAQ